MQIYKDTKRVCRCWRGSKYNIKVSQEEISYLMATVGFTEEVLVSSLQKLAQLEVLPHPFLEIHIVEAGLRLWETRRYIYVPI